MRLAGASRDTTEAARGVIPGWDTTHLSAGSGGACVSEYAKPGKESAEEHNTLSIPWVVLAAILCGVGIFLVTGALIRLAGGLVNWVWWIGILPAAVGFLMLMSPRAGSQGPH